MLKRSRVELVLCFLLGVAIFGFYETIASFQALNCSHQEQEKRETQPHTPSALAQEKGKDWSEYKSHSAIDEPFVCSILGFPTAARIFANRNEGAVVGGFTMLLVFVTGWLVRATIQLWKGAEDTAQRQLRAYVSVESGDHWRQSQKRKTIFEFRPVVKNNGQTPANRVRIISMMDIKSPLIPANFNFDLPDLPGGPVGSVTTIGAGQSKFHSRVLPEKVPLPELREIVAAKKCFHVWGVVRYEDVFERPQHTNFSFMIFVGRRRSFAIWHNTERHNDAT